VPDVDWLTPDMRGRRLVMLDAVVEGDADAGRTGTARFQGEREYVFRQALVREAAYGMLTDEEMARELNVSTDEFQEQLVRISNSTVVALDELWAVSDSSGDAVSLLDTLQDPDALDPSELMDATDMKDRVADAIARLPEREKLVVALYYYENLTLREIGEVLGVTESRVSQLHTKAILRLKARLAGSPAREPLGR
jgi:RNA polymerase sigma factor (sigma-70 family)